MTNTKNIEKEEKMTNLKALEYVLSNCKMPADVKEKISKMAEQQKNKFTNRKKAADMEENIKLIAEIEKVLTNSNKAMNATEIFLTNDTLKATSNQKVSNLLKVLIDEGKVKRELIKGRAFFSLAK